MIMLILFQFIDWASMLREANTLLDDREQKVLDCYKMLETNLNLLGATAIEDTLQQDVPETIALLRKAGLKVWMLTGDKRATAEQIAIACNLFDDESTEKRFQLDAAGKSQNELKLDLDQYISACGLMNTETHSSPLKFSLVIDGTTLRRIIDDETCCESFVDLAMMARSVVCCRVSPSQKSSIVALVKKRGKMTLAIGDGGNDVAMIQSILLYSVFRKYDYKCRSSHWRRYKRS